MVEGTGLENRRTGNGIESSNLSLSVGARLEEPGDVRFFLWTSLRWENSLGRVAEWFKAHAWKACVRESVPRVRISLRPCPWSGLAADEGQRPTLPGRVALPHCARRSTAHRANANGPKQCRRVTALLRTIQSRFSSNTQTSGDQRLTLELTPYQTPNNSNALRHRRMRAAKRLIPIDRNSMEIPAPGELHLQ